MRARSSLGFGLAILAGLGACAGSDPPPLIVDFAGDHLVHVGDDPGFAARELDDSGWQRVRLPGSWRAGGLSMPEVRWYRIHFDLPAAAADQDLAVSLGIVGWADEVFLDGRRIGGVGRDGHHPDYTFHPRLYPVPRDLRAPGAHVLAVRTRGAPLTRNGFLSDRIGIGPAPALMRARDRQLSGAIAIEGLLLGVALFTWILLATMPKRGASGRAAIFLWAFMTTQIVHLSLGSGLGGWLGIDQEGNTKVRFLALSIGLGALWAFCAVIARGRVPRIVLGMIAVSCSLGLLGLVISEIGFLVALMTVLGTCADVVTLALLVLAVRARTPGALPALVGYVGALAFIWATFVVVPPFIHGVGTYYFGIAWLALGGLVALARRVDVMQQQAQRASEYALAAHTRERTRLARDLHDGVGQMLALLKLSMQRAGSRVDDTRARNAVAEGVTHLDAALEELRRVARDLRPTPLDNRTFGEAVRDYAAAVARRSGIEVQVDGDYDQPVPAPVASELYRIVQESLTNCLKHSQATRIVVSMAGGDELELTVTDNGRGLTTTAGDGIGLHTIRERSELLGGTCRFTTPEGGGTRIEVRVPDRH